MLGTEDIRLWKRQQLTSEPQLGQSERCTTKTLLTLPMMVPPSVLWWCVRGGIREQLLLTPLERYIHIHSEMTLVQAPSEVSRFQELYYRVFGTAECPT